MLRVCDVMTPHVVTLSPDASLREAIDTLVNCRIGGAPVVELGRVVGVLSAPDILEFQSLTPVQFDPGETEAVAFEPSEEWRDGDESSAMYYSGLWMPNDETIAERFESTHGPQWDFLNDHTVAEAMSRAVCAVPDGQVVPAAARHMLACGVQRAVVMSEGKVVGILTTTDILRVVAEGLLTARHFISRLAAPARKPDLSTF